MSAPTSTTFASGTIEVESPAVEYSADKITSTYSYDTTEVTIDAASGKVKAVPTKSEYKFVTDRVVPRTGVMFVGWGGNNGTTVTAGILANKHNISWETKRGMRSPDYVGSLTQSSTVRLGSAAGSDVYVPFKAMLPMVNPNDLVVGGWDISGMPLGDAMRRAEVLDVDLQRRLYPMMKDLKPLPSIYFPDFIAANQSDRADNVLTGTKREQMEQIRKDIRDFKAANSLDKVIVLWTANTERFADILPGVNDTVENFMAALDAGHEEISPSSLFAVASILEGCSYINGSPQNTFVPAVMDLAEQHKVFIGGDDFKSGQTKIKSVLVPWLVNAGIKPESIVSWNHLGNNDGKNLSAPKQFRSKEISKSNVVDDSVGAAGMLYPKGEHPDHLVAIKYMPFVGDSKRAMDEYTSSIFMGGINTITLYNVCEDSLLASPLIVDLVILTEMLERIAVQRVGIDAEPQRFHSVLSLLSYLTKAPLVPRGTPVINDLNAQREALVNVFRACVGLPPENSMLLEHRVAGAGTSTATAGAGAAAAATTAAYEPSKAELMAKEAAEKALDA